MSQENPSSILKATDEIFMKIKIVFCTIRTYICKGAFYICTLGGSIMPMSLTEEATKVKVQLFFIV